MRMAEFEVRHGGMTVAAVSGEKERAYREAWNYYEQYLEDATEDEPVELVEVILVATTDVYDSAKRC